LLRLSCEEEEKEGAMPNTHYLVTAVSLPLLVLACGGDASRPLGPGDEFVQSEVRPAGPAAATLASRRHEIISFGDATFLSTDASGCVESVFDIFGSEERLKDEQPGAPSTTGFALVIVGQFDQCTGTDLGQIVGEIRSDAVVFETTGNLSTATLQATVPALDFTGAEVEVTLTVTWTGFGPIFPEVNKVRLKTPDLLQIFRSKATIRQATTSGTASLDGETFPTLEPLAPGQIGRAKSGALVVQFN
jgi:hypothetical protein